jgi:hypothetical protein
MSVAIASTAVVYLAVALMLVVAATVSMPRDSRQHNEMGGI